MPMRLGRSAQLKKRLESQRQVERGLLLLQGPCKLPHFTTQLIHQKQVRLQCLFQLGEDRTIYFHSILTGRYPIDLC